MRKNSFIIILLIITNTMFSQQTPVLGEYHRNPFLINPAYAGLTSKEISLNHNSSFGGFDGTPSTSSLTYTSDIPYQLVGYGLGILNDEIGVTKTTSLFGALSYRIEFDHASSRADWEIYDMNVLSFGLTLGVQIYQDNLLDLNINNDPNFAQNINLTIPTIGSGIMYSRANFFVGLSSPNLIGTALSTDNIVEIKPQFYGYTGFKFYATKFEKILLKPSILMKYQNGAPFQTDFNISGVYNKKFELGMGYRTISNFNMFLSFYISKKLKFNYSYNQQLNNAPISNTHGFGLNYKFKR